MTFNRIASETWKLRCAPHGYDLHPADDENFERLIVQVHGDDAKASDETYGTRFAEVCVLLREAPALLRELKDFVSLAEDRQWDVPRSVYKTIRNAEREP